MGANSKRILGNYCFVTREVPSQNFWNVSEQLKSELQYQLEIPDTNSNRANLLALNLHNCSSKCLSRHSIFSLVWSDSFQACNQSSCDTSSEWIGSLNANLIHKNLKNIKLHNVDIETKACCTRFSNYFLIAPFD